MSTAGYSKGITLIALVVTIVVLLILAGVTITFVLGEGGILNMAKKAADETKKAAANDQADITNLAGQIENLVGGGSESGTTTPTPEEPTKNAIAEQYGIKQTEENKELSDGAGGKIVVPKDYTIVNPDTDETIEYKDKNNPTVKEGIVIKDDEENEFVWVPVTEPSTMYGEDIDGNYIGKLYNFSSSETTASNWEEKNGKISWKLTSGSGSYREPDIVTDDTTKGISETELRKEFKNMCDSVAKYKGFYIGRYETSLSEGKVASKKGESLTNDSDDNNWYGQYEKNKAYATKEENKSVVSSTIWGSQYDAMLRWMQSNGIDVTNGTPTDITGNPTSRNTTRTTGPQTDTNDKLCNIYDLLGNSREWTMEANSTYRREYRGGVYDQSYAPAKRYDGGISTLTDNYCSARLSLYVNL